MVPRLILREIVTCTSQRMLWQYKGKCTKLLQQWLYPRMKGVGGRGGGGARRQLPNTDYRGFVGTLFCNFIDNTNVIQLYILLSMLLAVYLVVLAPPPLQVGQTKELLMYALSFIKILYT